MAATNTRERILEVTERLLAEAGYHGLRLQRVAEEVGIQKASLFHYFRSKADLYRAVVEKGFEEAEALVRQALSLDLPPLEKARALAAAYVDLVATHRERTTIFLRQALGDAPPGYQPEADARRVLDIVVGYIRAQQAAGVFAPVDPVALVLGIVGMVAFFFTSSPVIRSVWEVDPRTADGTRHLRDHVAEAVVRWLTPPALGRMRPAAAGEQ